MINTIFLNEFHLVWKVTVEGGDSKAHVSGVYGGDWTITMWHISFKSNVSQTSL